MDKLLELINSVKTASKYNEIEIWGNKKSFDELMASGFPLGNFKHKEIEFDESRIMIIPCEPKPLKLYLNGNDN